MKPGQFLLSVLYWLLLGLDCLLLINNTIEYRLYTKSLLMPVLYASLILSTQDSKHRRSRSIISLALLFSFVGDVLLLYELNPSYLTFGLACFVLSYILYAIFFYRVKPFFKRGIPLLLTAAVILLGWLAALLYLIWSMLVIQNLQIPIVFYFLILFIMLLTVMNTANGKRMRKLSLKYFIPGGLLLLASNSIFALNKYYFKDPVHEVFFMLCYGAAQYLIVTGAIRIIKK